jgi:hypothetical protein
LPGRLKGFNLLHEFSSSGEDIGFGINGLECPTEANGNSSHFDRASCDSAFMDRALKYKSLKLGDLAELDDPSL